MSWIEVRSRFRAETLDLSIAIEAYRDHGIENTLEQTGELTGCLVNVEGVDERIELLTTALSNAGALAVEVRALPEENWEEAWKAFFHPRRVGRRFVVRPTWESYGIEPGDLEIILDPGQAFGTGDHPTTRMCLSLLENAHVRGKHVLDLGCGSGILAVAACRLRAAQVDATDIDGLAIEVAKQNARLNQVEFYAFVGEGLGALTGRQGRSSADVEHDETPLTRQASERGDEEGVGGSAADESQLTTGFPAPPQRMGDATRSVRVYDVIVSNIISATLIRLAPGVAHILKHGGAWIVSGIIEANWPDVRRAAKAQGFELVVRLEEDGWVAAAFVRL